MKQIVKFEFFLSNSDDSCNMVLPTLVFEESFDYIEGLDCQKQDDAEFDFEWKIRSFANSCKDVFKYVRVSKSVTSIDYSFD